MNMICKHCNQEKTESQLHRIFNDWAICHECKAAHDKEHTAEKMDSPQEVPQGTTCQACGKDISGQHLCCSGFGGYRDPTYTFVCEDCRDEANYCYEQECISAEIYQDQCWENY